MYSKSKLFVLFFILLSALAITVNEVKAADSFTLQTWVGGVRIGDTMPRNVAQTTLSSSIINFKYVNNSNDTFYKISFRNDASNFNINVPASFSSNRDSIYTHTGFAAGYYSDSAGFVNATYRVSPNSTGKDSSAFRLNSYTAFGPTVWENFYASVLGPVTTPTQSVNSLSIGSDPNDAKGSYFLFQPIAINDIGFDIRYDSTYRNELTGPTVNIKIATYNSTQVDGRITGSDTDRRDNLTYKSNGLVYFVEGAGNDFQNQTLPNNYSYTISHPSFQYNIKADSRSYTVGSANAAFAVMRKLKFQIVGIEGNKTGNTTYSNQIFEDTHGVGIASDLYYPIENHDTTFYLYVNATEDVDTTKAFSSQYNYPVKDLNTTDMNLWKVFYDTGINYGESIPVIAVSNVYDGVYKVTVRATTGNNWLSFFEFASPNSACSLTVTNNYYNTPSGLTATDSFYFALQDSAVNLIKILNVELLTDSIATQPMAYFNNPITVDLKNDSGSVLSTRLAVLSSVDTIYPLRGYTDTTVIDTITYSFTNSSGNAITAGINRDNSPVYVKGVSDTFFGSYFTFVRSTYAPAFNITTRDTVSVHDTAVYKHAVRGGQYIYIIDGNDSNRVSNYQKAGIQVVDLSCTTEITGIRHFDDDSTTLITIRLSNTGSETIGYFAFEFTDSNAKPFILKERVSSDSDIIYSYALHNRFDTQFNSTGNEIRFTGATASDSLPPYQNLLYSFYVQSIDNFDTNINVITKIRSKSVYALVPDTSAYSASVLKANEYLYDTYANNIKFEIHNLECTVAMSPSVIDDSTVTSVTFTIYNVSPAFTNEKADSFRIMIPDLGNTLRITGISAKSATIADSRIISAASFSGNDSIEIKLSTPLAPGETCSITASIESLDLLYGDTTNSVLLSSFGNADTVNIVDTYNTNLKTVDLSCTMNILTYQHNPVYREAALTDTYLVNGSYNDTIIIQLYNQVRAGQIDSATITLPAAFKDTIVIDYQNIKLYSPNGLNMAGAAPALNRSCTSFNSANYSISVDSPLYGGGMMYVVIPVTRIANISTSLYNQAISLAINRVAAANGTDTITVSDTLFDNDTCNYNKMSLLNVDFTHTALTSTTWSDSEWVHFKVKLNNNTGEKVSKLSVIAVSNASDKIDSMTLDRSFSHSALTYVDSAYAGLYDTFTVYANSDSFSVNSADSLLTIAYHIPKGASGSCTLYYLAYTNKSDSKAFSFDSQVITLEASNWTNSLNPASFDIKNNDTKTISFTIYNPSYTNGIDTVALTYLRTGGGHDTIVFTNVLSPAGCKSDSIVPAGSVPADTMGSETYTLYLYKSDTYVIPPRTSVTFQLQVATYNISINGWTSQYKLYLMKHDTFAGGPVNFGETVAVSPKANAWLFDSSKTLTINVQTANVQNITSDGVSDSFNIASANNTCWVGADLNLGSGSAGKENFNYWKIHLIKASNFAEVAELQINQCIHDTNTGNSSVRYNFNVNMPSNNSSLVDTETAYKFRVTYIGQDGNFSAIDTSTILVYYYKAYFKDTPVLSTIARSGIASGTMQILVSAMINSSKAAAADTSIAYDTTGSANDTGYVIKIYPTGNPSSMTTLPKYSVGTSSVVGTNDTIIVRVPNTLAVGLYDMVISYTKPYEKYSCSQTIEKAVYVGTTTIPASSITVTYPTANGFTHTAAKVGDQITISMTLNDSGLGTYTGGVQAISLGDTYTANLGSDSITRPINFSGNTASCTIVVGNTITATTNAILIIKSTHGDSLTVAVDIAVDTLAPTTTPVISGVTYNDSFGGTSKQITVTVSDALGTDTRGISKINLYWMHSPGNLIDSAVFSNTDVVSWTGTWTFASFPTLKDDTGYSVVAEVYDRAGNCTYSATVGALKIDRTAPVLTSVTLPDSTYQVYKGQNFVYDLLDSSVVTSRIIQISKNGVDIFDAQNITNISSSYSDTSCRYVSRDTYSFAFNNLPTGDWFYRIIVADVFGNATTTSWKYIRFINENATATDIAVKYPVNTNGIWQTAAKLNDVITITAEVIGENDTKVEIKVGGTQTSYVMYDNGLAGDSLANDKVYGCSIVAGVNINYLDTVNLVVTNKNGELTSYRLSVDVDTSIVAPVLLGVNNSDSVYGTVKLNATLNNTDIKKIRYSYLSGTIDTTPIAVFENANTADTALWQTDGIGEGFYKLAVEIWDKANNYSYSVKSGIYVDNDRPVLSSYTVVYPTMQSAIKSGQSAAISVHVVDGTRPTNTISVQVKRGVYPAGTLLATLVDSDSDNVFTGTLSVPAQLTETDTYFYIVATNSLGDTYLMPYAYVNVDTQIAACVVLVNSSSTPDTISGVADFGMTIATDTAGLMLVKYSLKAQGLSDSVILESTFTATEKFALVTNDIPQGYYSLIVEAWDRANNYTTDSATFFIDNNAPIVKITYPVAGAMVTGTVPVKINVVDSNVISSCWISIDGTDTWLPVTISGGQITLDPTYNWNTVADTYNIYNVALRVKAQDNKGNIGYSEILNVQVNNLVPSANFIIQYPTNQTAVKNGDVVKFTIEPFDSTDTKVELLTSVGEYAMFDDGTNNDSVAMDRIYTKQITINTELRANDTSAIRLTNRNGNVYVYPVSVVIDNSLTAPVIKIENNGYVNLTEGDTLNATQLLGISGDADIQRVKYSLLVGPGFAVSTLLQDAVLGETITFPTTDAPSGEYMKVLVEVWDKANNYKSDTKTIFIDNAGPAAVITYPAAGAYLTDIVPVALNAKDSNTITATYLSINGGEWILVNTNLVQSTISTPNAITFVNSFVYNWDTRIDTLTSAALQVKSVDNEGNIGYSQIINVNINNIVPAANFEVAYPTANTVEQTAAKNGDVVTVSVEVFDLTDTKVEILVGPSQTSTELVDDASNGDVTANDRVYSRNMTIGTHIVEGNTTYIKLTNKNGHIMTYPITIVIDNSISNITFSGIATGDTVSNSSLFGVNTVDNDLKRIVYTASATRNEVLMSFDIADKTDTNKISFVWPQVIGDGFCDVNVKVYDKANNTKEATVKVYIDNTRPTVAIVSPAANSYLTGSIQVGFTAVDVNVIQSVNFYVNGKLTETRNYTATSVADTFIWDSSSDTRLQSNVIFSISALDIKNNINGADLPIFIDNSRPTVSLINPDTMTYISGTYQLRSMVSNADQLWYSIVNAANSNDSYIYIVSPWSTDTYVNFGLYQNGTYTVTAVAKNSVSGNMTVSSGMIIKVDNYAPSFTDPVVVTPGPLSLNAASGYKADVYRDWASIALNIIDSNVEDLKVEVTSNAEIKAQYASTSGDSSIKVVANLEDGVNTITVKVTDKAGNFNSKTIVLNYVQPTITKTPVNTQDLIDTILAQIYKTAVIAPDSTSVLLPAGALSTVVPITIEEVDPYEINIIDNASIGADSIINLRIARDFGPEGTLFEKRVRIGIKYYESDLAELKSQLGASFDETKLKIRYWNGSYYEDIVADTVDTVNDIVYAYVNHFSRYVIVYDMRLALTTNTAKIYPTRNPLVANLTGLFDNEKGTTFKIDSDADLIASFRVEIFTLRGQKVTDITRTTNEVYWGGLSTNDRFIGSGLYLYKATVTFKTGQTVTTSRPIGLLKQ